VELVAQTVSQRQKPFEKRRTKGTGLQAGAHLGKGNLNSAKYVVEKK